MTISSRARNKSAAEYVQTIRLMKRTLKQLVAVLATTFIGVATASGQHAPADVLFGCSCRLQSAYAPYIRNEIPHRVSQVTRGLDSVFRVPLLGQLLQMRASRRDEPLE